MIYADLQKTDDDGRLVLTTHGTLRDLVANNISLKGGLKLLFYSDDADDAGNQDNLVFEGIIQYDETNNRWLAQIDWNAIKNLSGLSPDERERLGIE